MRLFALLSISTLAFSLHAAVYESNALMQPLRLIPEVPYQGYYIVEDGNERTLYLDNEAVKTVISDETGETTITKDETVERRFIDGRLMSESVISDGRQTDLSYEYSENGILRRIIYSSDGEIYRVVQYNYSPLSGLTAVVDATQDTVSLYEGTSVSYRSEGKSEVRDGKNMIMSLKSGAEISAETDIVYNEDGGFSVRETVSGGLLVSTYDGNLVLRSEVLSDEEDNVISSKEYIYDRDGELFFIRETSDGLINDLYYVEGRLSEKIESTDTGVKNRYVYNEDGTIMCTRYREGKPYAAIHYDSDGRRVLSLEML